MRSLASRSTCRRCWTTWATSTGGVRSCSSMTGAATTRLTCSSSSSVRPTRATHACSGGSTRERGLPSRLGWRLATTTCSRSATSTSPPPLPIWHGSSTWRAAAICSRSARATSPHQSSSTQRAGPVRSWAASTTVCCRQRSRRGSWTPSAGPRQPERRSGLAFFLTVVKSATPGTRSSSPSRSHSTSPCRRSRHVEPRPTVAGPRPPRRPRHGAPDADDLGLGPASHRR